jgi:hypothetical protein
MKRGATILIGEDRIVMHPENPSAHGPSFIGLPMRALPHSASVEKILVELEATMADSKLVEPPTDLKASIQPLLAATGEKTWHAISRSFAYIGVLEDDGDGLMFFSGFPEKGAFLFRTEAQWRCKKSSHADVVLAFREAASVSIKAQNLHHPPPLP